MIAGHIDRLRATGGNEIFVSDALRVLARLVGQVFEAATRHDFEMLARLSRSNERNSCAKRARLLRQIRRTTASTQLAGSRARRSGSAACSPRNDMQQNSMVRFEGMAPEKESADGPGEPT